MQVKVITDGLYLADNTAIQDAMQAYNFSATPSRLVIGGAAISASAPRYIAMDLTPTYFVSGLRVLAKAKQEESSTWDFVKTAVQQALIVFGSLIAVLLWVAIIFTVFNWFLEMYYSDDHVPIFAVDVHGKGAAIKEHLHAPKELTTIGLELYNSFLWTTKVLFGVTLGRPNCKAAFNIPLFFYGVLGPTLWAFTQARARALRLHTPPLGE